MRGIVGRIDGWRRWLDAHDEWVALVVIMLLGAALRLIALDRLPPGLYHDEALNGLDALRVLDGETPIYFEANNGREPLFIYALATAVGLFGQTPGTLRLVSALFGVLTIPATYWLVRELVEDRHVALVSAFFCATTVWALNLSRVAFRAVAMPPLLAVALALLWRGDKKGRLGLIICGAIAYGFSFYTYLAARFSVVALFFFIVYMFLWHRGALRLKGWLAFLLVATIVSLPLALHVMDNWSETMGRAGQVSILNPAINEEDAVGTLLRHVWYTMRSLVYRGDFIPRHNVPLRPVYGPLVGTACLAGIGIALVRARRRPGYALALIVLTTMMMPTVLAEGAPHMLRGVGMLPVVFFFPALGLIESARRLTRLGCQALGRVLVALVLVGPALIGWSAYWEHLHSEAVYYHFESGATEMAVEINRYLSSGWRGAGLVAPTRDTGADARVVYIAPRLWRDWPSVRYLCPDEERLRILSEDSMLDDDAAGDLLVIMWPFEGVTEMLASLPRDRMIDVRPGARERGDLETESRLLYVTCRAVSLANVPYGTETHWREGIRLVGYRATMSAANRVEVDLYWATSAPVDKSYTVFCHVVSGGQLIGQDDALPTSGYHTTDRWRPGDVILDHHTIDLTTKYDTETCRIHIGLYQLETMERLDLVDAEGRPTGETSLVIAVRPS